MNRARQLLTLLSGGAVNEIVYLLRDDFTSPDGEIAAGTNSRTCTPGPGTLTTIAESGVMSIGSGALNFASSGSAGWVANRFRDDTARTRVGGLAVISRVIRSTATFNTIVGWSTNSGGDTSSFPAAAAFCSAEFTINAYSPGSLFAQYPCPSNLDVTLAIVLLPAGFALFGKFAGSWRLCAINHTSTVSPVYAAGQRFGAVAATFDSFYIRELAQPFTEDYSLATLNVTAPASASEHVGVSEGLIEFYFTLPASPSAGDEVGFRYRVQDANNYWYAYLKRNAGNTAWDARLDSVSSGSPTNRINVTGVATPTRLAVAFYNTFHGLYTQSGTTITQRGSIINVSHLNTETGLIPVYAAGTTSSALRAYPSTAPSYALLDST